MEHSKEYYQSFIRVIDFLSPSDVWDITPEKGIELAGNYWPEIGRVLKEEYRVGRFDYGQFHISKRAMLAPIREDCVHIIEKLKKEEKNTWLDNAGKRTAIICGIGGLIISIISLIFSIIAYNKV